MVPGKLSIFDLMDTDNQIQIMEELQLLEDMKVCKKWKLYFNSYAFTLDRLIDGRKLITYLKFSPEGGVAGIIISDKPTSDMYGADVFGTWTEQGISLEILIRKTNKSPPFCLSKLTGKWIDRTFSGVREGKVTGCEDSSVEGGSNELLNGGTFNLELDTLEVKQERKPKCEFLENIGKYYSQAPKEKQFYDFKIQCSDGAEVLCHRFILAAQTKYFEGLFRQQPPDTNSVSVNFSGDTIRTCINYLYTGDINIHDDNVQDVLMAAHYFLLN